MNANCPRKFSSAPRFCIPVARRLPAWMFLFLVVSVALGQDSVPDIVSAMKGGYFDLAVQLCLTAQKKTPRDPRAWTLEGIALTHLERPQEALAAYEHALQLDPHSLPALEGAAEVEYKLDSPRAVSLLDRILVIRPEDPTAHAMLAVMQYKGKDCARAVENFAQATAVIAGQPLGLTQYGYCLAELNRLEEAIPVFAQVLPLKPDSPSARYNLALAQWKSNHPTEALITLRPMIEGQSPDAELLSLAAEINDSAGNTPEAVELFRKAIQADPKNVQNYIGFAALSLNHDAFQAGIDMIDVGLTQIPTAAQLYLARGILYGELSQFDQSMSDFERANQLDPHLAFSSAAEGVLHSEKHDLKAAVESFRAEAKQHPDDALAQYLLAQTLAEQANTKGSPAYEEEIAAAKRALRLDPQLTAAHDLLSNIYLRDRQTKLALEQIHAALQSDPDDQTAVYHLILALRDTHQREQIPSLIKRLGELRRAEQAAAREKKRYQLATQPSGQMAGESIETAPKTSP
jgi:tetratricopeptide (TPR) repeat protein